MTARSDEQSAKPGNRTQKRLAVAILVAGVVVAVIVSSLQREPLSPEIETEDAQDESVATTTDLIAPGEFATSVDSKSSDSPPAAFDDTPAPPSRMAVESLPPAPSANAAKVSQKTAPARGPPADKERSTKPSSKAAPKQNSKPGPPGGLVEIGKSTYRSPAGLVYAPGSEEGHRYKHIMRHAQDDAQRPIHGVFDGKPDDVIAVVDEAWLIAKKGGKNVSTERERGRTVYLVDVGRRIGYIGGKAGKRQKNPAARHLRLVVEGQNVITAFPDRP